MKKLLTVLFATLLISTTAFAEEPFAINESVISVEKGQPIVINYNNAENDILVKVNNEYNSTIWEYTYPANESGYFQIDIPEDNPLTGLILHVYNNDVEKIVKVNFIIPHEHSMTYFDFIRPSDTEPGRRSYFYCPGCGKYFEDRGGTVEITKPIGEWSYLAPVPKEEWDTPAPYIPVEDDKNVTDSSKPNPSWEQERVDEYITNETETCIESTPDEHEKFVATYAIEPVTEKIEVVNKPDTLWEKLKMFFVNLFR